MELAGAVGGQDHHRPALAAAIVPELRDRHLELGQQLEQERLELVVGAVELVDQQHHGPVVLERLQQRPADQQLAPEERARVAPGRLGGADLQQLARVVPVIERAGNVDALVALQADQARAGRRRERLRGLGLADPGLALEQQRLLERGREEDRDRERLVGEVALRGERLADGSGVGEGAAQAPAACSSARRQSVRARWRL